MDTIPLIIGKIFTIYGSSVRNQLVQCRDRYFLWYQSNALCSTDLASYLHTPYVSCVLCPTTDPRILPCLHFLWAVSANKDREVWGQAAHGVSYTCQRSIHKLEDGSNAIPKNLCLGFEVEVDGYMSKIGSDGEKSCHAWIGGDKEPAVVFL